jgi:nitrogen regulatory protein PII
MTSYATHCGRRYAVLAKFEGEGREASAREYLRTHTHVRLLRDEADVVYIVSDRDIGTVVDAVDSDFGNLGWSSLYGDQVPVRIQA